VKKQLEEQMTEQPVPAHPTCVGTKSSGVQIKALKDVPWDEQKLATDRQVACALTASRRITELWNGKGWKAP